MKMNNFFENLNIFFVGIGGISMSGLGRLCKSLKSKVSGSDINFNAECQKLQSENIKVFGYHDPKHITKDIDLVVFSGAISKNNCELIQAKKLGIKTLERSKLLGLISQQYSHVIAISGTHGKTTTVSLLSEIFLKANKNPTIHIGGESVNLNDNTIIGGKDYFIVEACEYRKSFLSLKPEMACITNIDADHLDYYKDYKEIHKAFEKFAKNSVHLVSCSDIKHKNIIDLNKDFRVENIEFCDSGYTFDVYKNNLLYDNFRINCLGCHNIKNALCAIAISDFYGISKDTIKDAVQSFRGVKRRYEIIGEIQNTKVMIDYAHHPTEIENSIEGLKNYYKNILIIFQPHTYSRTLTLFDDFVRVLKRIKHLIIYKTYPARESKITGGDATDLYNQLGGDVKYFDTFDSLKSSIQKTLKRDNFDLILILGAGDLAEIFKEYMNTY